MDWDPFNFKKFEHTAQKVLKALFFTSLIFGGLSVFFFIISLFTGGNGSSTSTVSTWKENDTGKYLSALTMKMKIMPSQGHGVQETMNWTNVESQEIKDLLKKNSLDKYTPSYHLYSTNTAMKFATFIFTDEMVPAGDSQEKCLYIELATNSDRKNPSAYKAIEEMPDCSRSKNGWWNFHDPKIGIDLPTWYQNELTLDCSGKSCIEKCTKKNGLWVLKVDGVHGICYTYDILTHICVTVDTVVDTFGKFHLKYSGGCYAENNPGVYVAAKPGNTYRFEKVPIYVRARSDPYVQLLHKHEKIVVSEENSGNLMRKISLFFFVVGIGAGIGCAVYYKKEEGSGRGYGQSE
ncbi:hypothetical protein SteCoe_2386 [Stentor coeruleus]|uniref:Uncharacterized protein n=1 Tax=Stentor coeruleus TaxID=5963 RepID=A0A1R2CZP5_9CILI|nr:hypothetical protein SteCoe_2386 [Stentor coeruleus]